MLVKCIKELDNNLCKLIGKEAAYYGYGGLEVGKHYVVYAVYYKKFTSYHLWTDNYIPSHYPSCLFEIVDPRLSKYWVYGSYPAKKKKRVYFNESTIVSYPRWALHYEGFWDKFVDGDKEIREEFFKYKELMDKEYQTPDIKFNAEIGEDNWVKCPKCVNIWQVDKSFEVISCPDCDEMLINDYAVKENKFKKNDLKWL